MLLWGLSLWLCAAWRLCGAWCGLARLLCFTLALVAASQFNVQDLADQVMAGSIRAFKGFDVNILKRDGNQSTL